MTRGVAALALALGLTGCGGPVEVAAPALAPGPAQTCARLVAALPETVAGQSSREVSPTEAAAAAWGDPPIVVRCGVAVPDGMTAQAQLFEVDGLAWYPEELPDGYRFTTYDREPRVEVVVPGAYAPEISVVAAVGEAVRATVPAAG
ncbi:MAG: DUF3515 domain-containing protein [Actinomycetota bacterium]|nr:DUF3515 domain-containing protein [Actinomycetota bacterium]MDH5277721.1 DUF3515 domain-containing protein [Actinomycetota bacterium]